LKEKDELRTRRFSRPLPFPPLLLPSSPEEEEASSRNAPLLLLVLVVVVLPPQPRDGSTKARPCRHMEAAWCWEMGACGK
jgi:hypothetical protein